MRLKQRRNVLLPQPDGPISAVTSRSPIGIEMSLQRLKVAVPEAEVADLDLGWRRRLEPGLWCSERLRPLLGHALGFGHRHGGDERPRLAAGRAGRSARARSGADRDVDPVATLRVLIAHRMPFRMR